MQLTPIAPAAFRAALAQLGPFGQRYRCAVAVSGGPDSLALWQLMAETGYDAIALIVDHGLRPSSAAEAKATADQITARGGKAQILTLTPPPFSGSPLSWARSARYQALSDACRAAGIIDLYTAHHADDQAETVLERLSRGSGPHGLAGMSAMRPLDRGRLLRPLLGFHKAQLIATATASGWTAIVDPTNSDLRYARTRWRRLCERHDLAKVLGLSHAARDLRVADAQACTALLTETISAFIAGGVLVDGDRLRAADRRMARMAMAQIAACVGGRPWRQDWPDLALLDRKMPISLGQSLWRPHGHDWLVARAPRFLPAPMPITPPARITWDQRWLLQISREAPAGLVLGPLGAGALPAERRRLGLPDWLCATFPALRYGGSILACPLLCQASWFTAEPVPSFPLTA